MPDFLAQALNVAVAAARAAGKVQLRHYRTELKIAFKKKNIRNLVTNADLEADATIRRVIAARFPSHTIVTEEAAPRKGSSYTWHADPIDGTTNYTRGTAYFCVSIALAKSDEVLLGVVYNPLLSEMYTAVKGKGARLNGRKVKVSETASIDHALICSDLAHENENREKILRFIRHIAFEAKSIRLKGCGALAMCEIASGGAEAYVYPKSTSWDYSAGAIIIREAGGMVTALGGKEWSPASGSKAGILATNGLLHAQLLEKTKET